MLEKRFASQSPGLFRSRLLGVWNQSVSDVAAPQNPPPIVPYLLPPCRRLTSGSSHREGRQAKPSSVAPRADRYRGPGADPRRA